jgi:hypothetical protein
MKSKTFKIKESTLFVYKKSSIGKSETEPTTTMVTTATTTSRIINGNQNLR